jgi:hypothetical protein
MVIIPSRQQKLLLCSAASIPTRFTAHGMVGVVYAGTVDKLFSVARECANLG